MNKHARKFEEAMREVVHDTSLVSILGRSSREHLEALAKVAKLRSKVIAVGAKKQAKAILKAGTMGAPLCNFCQKNNISMEILQSEKVVAKAADKLARRAAKPRAA